MIISPIINGYVIMKLWAWFIVTTFNLPSLKIAQSVGIMLLINYFLAKLEKDSDKGFWESLGGKMIFILVYSILTLISGLIVKQFI